MLRQWAYCPRIPFFREALGIVPRTPKWVAHGIEFDAVQFVLSRDRRFRELGIERYRALRRVTLGDKGVGVHGIADLILLGPDRLYVCDYKLYATRVERGTRLQLAAYALLAEQKYEVHCAGLLVITGKPMRTLACKWDDTIRAQTREAIEQVQRMLLEGVLPASDAGPAKCGICEFLNYCNDRE